MPGETAARAPKPDAPSKSAFGARRKSPRRPLSRRCQRPSGQPMLGLRFFQIDPQRTFGRRANLANGTNRRQARSRSVTTRGAAPSSAFALRASAGQPPTLSPNPPSLKLRRTRGGEGARGVCGGRFAPASPTRHFSVFETAPKTSMPGARPGMTCCERQRHDLLIDPAPTLSPQERGEGEESSLSDGRGRGRRRGDRRGRLGRS